MLKEDPAEYSAAVTELAELRKTAAGQTRRDASTGTIEKVQRYIGQLMSARNRFPIATGEKVG